MDLKELLGSAYKENMTFAEINDALKDRKLVDLNGEKKYVDADKHKKVVEELDALKQATKDYETEKTELQTLRTEKTTREIGGKLAQWGVSDKFIDDVMVKVEKGKIAKDDDDKKFEANVKSFLKENSQYAKTGSSIRVVDTKAGGSTGGSGQGSQQDRQKELNEQVNNGLRDMFKPK